jgi:hypothetical protein
MCAPVISLLGMFVLPTANQKQDFALLEVFQQWIRYIAFHFFFFINLYCFIMLRNYAFEIKLLILS